MSNDKKITLALHILPDPQKALREIDRVLKEDGLLIAPNFVNHKKGVISTVWSKVLGIAGVKFEHQWSVAEYDGNGTLLEVGCGSGPLSIRAALTWPRIRVAGIDDWGAMWDYSKALCEKNAASEGVASQCTFQKGDASPNEQS